MNTLVERLLAYDGFVGTTWCHMLLDENQGVVLGELEGNPGNSLTNTLELACAAVSAQYFDSRDDFHIFEWLPRDLRTDVREMRQIKWHAAGFRLPEWVAPVTDPLAFVKGAERRIKTYNPYSVDNLKVADVKVFEVSDARRTLAVMQRDLPPEPRLPDRRPQRRRS